MKKHFLSLLVATLTFCISTQAQKVKKKTSRTTFGIQAGANMYKKVGKSYPNGDKLDLDFITGFHAGINVEIPLGSNLYIQPGLQFISKGAKDKKPNYTSTYTLYYAELPLMLLFKPQTGKGNLILGLGGDVAYGISGKWKYDQTGGNQNDKDGKFKFKNSVDASVLTSPTSDKYEKPLDVGVGILLGYQLGNGLLFQLNGHYGLTNTTTEIKLNNPAIVQGNAKNVGFGLSVGFRF